MLWDKRKYTVVIKSLEGSCTTEKLGGRIDHLIVIPENLDTLWDLDVIDSDGDIIMQVRDFSGRLDDKSGLPIGRDSMERLTFHFQNVSHLGRMVVILKIKEKD